jgi:hypothetical protein
VIRLIPGIVLIYLSSKNIFPANQQVLLRILLIVIGHDYLGIFCILYMLIIDAEALWLTHDQYVLTSANIVTYEDPIMMKNVLIVVEDIASIKETIFNYQPIMKAVIMMLIIIKKLLLIKTVAVKVKFKINLTIKITCTTTTINKRDKC